MPEKGTRQLRAFGGAGGPGAGKLLLLAGRPSAALRCAAPDIPTPAAPGLEAAFLPSRERIRDGLEHLLTW